MVLCIVVWFVVIGKVAWDSACSAMWCDGEDGVGN